MAEKKKSDYLQVTVQLRKSDITQLDEWAARSGMSRSAVLRMMVEDRKTAQTHN